MSESFPNTLGNKWTKRRQQDRHAGKNAIERGIECHFARLSRIAAPHAGAAAADVPIIQRVEKHRKDLSRIVDAVAVHIFGNPLYGQLSLRKDEPIEFIELESIAPDEVRRRNLVDRRVGCK